MNLSVVKFDNTKPVYIQIMDIIKKQIINGDINIGEKLLSVRELSGDMEVNVNTMQRAYKELEREGVTLTKRGMGSFVTEDIELINKLKNNMARDIVTRFLKDMDDMGFNREGIINILEEGS